MVICVVLSVWNEEGSFCYETWIYAGSGSENGLVIILKGKLKFYFYTIC